jgi:hypothetical protein
MARPAAYNAYLARLNGAGNPDVTDQSSPARPGIQSNQGRNS